MYLYLPVWVPFMSACHIPLMCVSVAPPGQWAGGKVRESETVGGMATLMGGKGVKKGEFYDLIIWDELNLIGVCLLHVTV